jgi:hypothetical protein
METRDGELYFVSGRPGSIPIPRRPGASNIYYARRRGADYALPVTLGDSIPAMDFVVSPDGRAMLVILPDSADASVSRLGLSERRGEAWTVPALLDFRTGGRISMLRVTPDGGELFFSSSLTGSGDIYRVDMRALKLSPGVARSFRQR